jgi:hypothetical protein
MIHMTSTNTLTIAQQKTANRIAEQYRRVRKVNQTSRDALTIRNTGKIMDRLMIEAVAAGVRAQVSDYIAR